MKCKICKKDCGKYVVCYKHRLTKYKDVCKIHGRTDFIGRQCLKCKNNKEPIYIIRDGYDRFDVEIDKNHYLFPYVDRLTNLSKSYQSQFMQNITATSGIYGIFWGKTCLYVGQSVNIKKRISQHKDNFKIAKYHINGIRVHKPRMSISKMPHKVEYKYYEMAHKYKLSELTFKKLFAVPKLENEFQYKELLTYAEQAMMITYKPKFNHMAARPSTF